MSIVRAADRLIGKGSPCFLAAEIGINHNGSLELAHRTIDAAARAGADAVKFQNYRTEDFLSGPAETYEYVSQGRRVVESQYDMFKRYELKDSQFVELQKHCEERGLIFFSTPSSIEGVQFLAGLGVPVLKNGSDYLANLPVIRAMARSGIPTIMSTGMATLAEIDDAVRAYREAGGAALTLLHCVSVYPAPLEHANLRKISTLAEAFGCPAGFSDHTDGVVAATVAVALGAVMVEKHFTLDRNLPGPDHRFSSDESEFRNLVDAVRGAEKALGAAEIGLTEAEEQGRKAYRLSCVAAQDLPLGHVLRGEDIAFHRPGNHLPPKAADWLKGQKLGRDVAKGKPFELADLH